MVRTEDVSARSLQGTAAPLAVQLGAPELLPFPLGAAGGTKSSMAGRMPAVVQGQSKANSRMSSRSSTGAMES